MKLKIFLPIAAVVLLLAGVVLLALTLASPSNDFIKDVTLNDNGTTQETLEMSANGLIPGDSREYTLNFKGQSTGSYALNFEFVEIRNSFPEDSVKVTFKYGEKEDESATYDLLDLLGGQVVTLKLKVVAKRATAVRVIYWLPLEVGNDAQNAAVDFVVNLSADKI